MQLLGATVVPVESGTRTLKDATNEALRDWVTNVPTTHYIIGSVVGPDPYPRMVRDFQSVIGREARAQMLARDRPAAAHGGGLRRRRLATRWASSPASSTTRACELVGVEAAGEGLASGHHSAHPQRGRARRAARQPELSAAGRRRPGGAGALGVGGTGLSRRGSRAQLAPGHRPGRATTPPPTRRRWTRSRRVCRLEGIIPALETAHAFAWRAADGRPLAPPDAPVLVCLSGRGDKDVAHVARLLGSPGVTDGPVPTEVLPASQVAELINGLVKALRAFHMYLPNNPIYQRARENLRTAFPPIWAVLDELVLTVAETDFVWEEQVVYHQLNKNESLAWGLFKDGMRSLTIRRGAEQEELPRFLEMINRARFLPADAGDDLLTLLWEQEFQFIQYQFVEFFGEGGGAMPEQTGSYPTGRRRSPSRAAAAGHRRRRRRRPGPRAWSTSRTSTPRSTSSTSAEINQVARRSGGGVSPRRPDRRAQRRSSTSSSCRATPDIRDEILGILDQLFPNLLNARRLPDRGRGAARVQRARGPRARASPPAHRARLEAFVAKLSEPAIVRQLLQSLDEAPSLAGEARRGRGAARASGRGARADPDLDPGCPRRRSAHAARGVGRPAGRGAPRRKCCGSSGHPESEALRGGGDALRPAQAACRRCPAWARPWSTGTAAVRLAAVQALAQLGTPAALALIDQAIEDADRGVRAGRRAGGRRARLQGRAQAGRGRGARQGRQGDGPHREDGLLRGLRRDRGRARPQVAERRAAAARAAPHEGILRDPRLRRHRAGQDPHPRGAGGAGAGREDKDLVVRNAVSRALRESAA